MRIVIVLATAAVAVVMLLGGYLLPIPGWVLGIPALVLMAAQGAAFAPNVARWAFPAGDYVYYLGIGVVLGLGSLVVENTTALSERIADNERLTTQQRLAAAIVQIEQTEAAIRRQEGEIERARGVRERAVEDYGNIDLSLSLACQDAQIRQRLERMTETDPQLRDRPRIERFDLAPRECLALEGAILAVPRAKDAVDAAKRQMASLKAMLSDAERTRDAAQAELDGGKTGEWFWERMSDAQRGWLLFEVFPCLLLIGVAIKIGKTTATLLK